MELFFFIGGAASLGGGMKLVEGAPLPNIAEGSVTFGSKEKSGLNVKVSGRLETTPKPEIG